MSKAVRDTYKNIRDFSNALLVSIVNGRTTFPDNGKVPLIIIIEKDEIQRLLDAPNCERIGLIPGIEDSSTGKITISMLALDANGQILQEHVDGTLDGEEKWPKERVITFWEYDPRNANNRYTVFFQRPPMSNLTLAKETASEM